MIQAPAHVASPSIAYVTNQINPKLASVLFSLGALGIVVGSWVIFATRPKMNIA